MCIYHRRVISTRYVLRISSPGKAQRRIAFFLSALDNDETLVSPLIRAHVNAAVIDGEVWVAKLAQDDTIIAAALWFGPGAMFLKTQVSIR